MKSVLVLGGMSAFLLMSIAAPAGMDPQGKILIHPFDYHHVRLDGGRLKEQFELVKREYMSIPAEDLLVGFRKRAGIAAPGKEIGGWYSDDFFHCFGQIISGLSRMAAASGDYECNRRVSELVEGWAACVRPDGYFYYSNRPNATHYTYEKMVGGLVDAYLYCDNNTAREMLSRITDWAIKNLDREKKYAFNSIWMNTEWYTLSENLYRAYLATGDIKYRDFAEVWEYNEYWAYYAFGKDILSRYNDYHAYSHVNALSGAAMAYRIKGDRWYLDTLVNAHDYLRSHQTFATGGYGPLERFRERDRLVKSLRETDFHFETQCGSWAVFKLCKYLLEYTGDARFGDWIELMTYNGIGASVPIGENGQVQYTSNYHVHGGKKTRINPWSCCSGTRPMAVADYYDLVWFRDASSIYLNLYTPSTLQASVGETGVEMSYQRGANDFEGTLKVVVQEPCRFAVKLRNPGWLAEPMQLKVNGQKVSAERNVRNWVVIDRVWNNNDEISVHLPAKLTVSSLDPAKTLPAAVMYGPVVLAGEMDGMKTAADMNFDDIDSELVCDDAGNLVFSHKSDETLRMRPFYSFGFEEPYFMYIDR